MHSFLLTFTVSYWHAQFLTDTHSFWSTYKVSLLKYECQVTSLIWAYLVEMQSFFSKTVYFTVICNINRKPWFSGRKTWFSSEITMYNHDIHSFSSEIHSYCLKTMVFDWNNYVSLLITQNACHKPAIKSMSIVYLSSLYGNISK